MDRNPEHLLLEYASPAPTVAQRREAVGRVVEAALWISGGLVALIYFLSWIL